jgi:hypothetical protein
MFAAFSVTGSAQVTNPDTFPDFFTWDTNECYFASVSNGEDFGLGASQTSITVQNLDDEEGTVYILVGTGDGFDEAAFAGLQAGASKTFTAADLGIESGTTAPVAVLGYDFASSQAGEFTPEDGITLGCVAKQAVAGGSLPYTTAEDTSVSGYNATSGREVGFFDELYLPVVQTNCGPGGCWNSVLRVANVGPFDNAAVTVRFFAADNAVGSLNTGFQLESLLNQGEVWSIDLSEWVPEGWVGSAHILTDDAVVATVDRYKAGTDMWITNTASNAAAESDLQVPGGPANAPFVLFAPDVRLDFNGWNTGISVANTVDTDNNVNIQYFGNNGNAPQGQAARIAAHGMTYFYNPSDPSEDECEQPADQVPTCDFVGAAIVLSEYPVAAAIDGVKYFGNDANVGQAFSYSATANAFELQAAPLVQKGSPATGMGATSGITFLNPNAGATFITVDWVNPSGFDASNFGDTVVWVPGFATGFVYTMFQNNLPNGFSGSALVTSQLPIAASSANVDYQVQGDGTPQWTLYNPSALYRQIGECEFVAPIETATKILDTNVADALVCIFAVGDAGQDGKPELPTECDVLPIGVKGGEGPGQGEATTYFADLGDEGDVASVTYDDATNEITADVFINGGLTVDAEYTAVIAGFGGCDLNDDGDCDDAGEIGGDDAVCPPAGTDTLPNAFTGDTIIDLGTATADADGDLTVSFEDTLTVDEEQELGTPEDNVVLVLDADGTIVACGQIEAGTVEFESFEDAAVRLGAEFVGVTDAEGDLEVTLPLGDYVAIITAEGFVTATEEFTLDEAGEIEVNEVNLEGDGGGPVEEGSLTKTFVDSAGNPIDELLVTVTDEAGNVTEVGPVDDEGSFTIDPINFGTYELCWTDISDDTDLVQFIDGCETITVPDAEGNEDVVVNNTLEMFAVLDVCVVDEESDAALAGASVIAIVDGEIVATGVTGANGEAELLIDAGVDTDEDGVDDEDTLVEVSASATGFTTSEGAVTIASEDADEACGFDATTGGTTIGTADILLGLDTIDTTQVVGVLKTVEFDGVAQEGLFVELLSITDGTTDCTAGTVVASGLTDAAGEVELVDPTPAPTGVDYCVNVWTTDEFGAPLVLLMTDGPLDLSASVGILPVTNELSEVAGVLDVVVDDSAVGEDESVVDSFINVFMAEAGDTADDCVGTTLVASGEGTTLSTVLPAGDYCVEAGMVTFEIIIPTFYSGVGSGTLPVGDPAGDVDITVVLELEGSGV